MRTCIVICVDKDWGYARDNQLPWHIPEDVKNYQNLMKSSKSGHVNAFILGRTTWENAPALDIQIMSGSIACVISSRSNLPRLNNVYYFKTLAKAQQFMARPPKPIDTLFIFGGKRIFLESIENKSVDCCIITRLPDSFDCNKLIPELEQELYKHFICTEYSYQANRNSVDFITEKWSKNKEDTFILKHIEQDLIYVLQCNAIPANSASLIQLFKFIIDSIHQFGNKKASQLELIEVICANCLQVFTYLFDDKIKITIRAEKQGTVLFQSEQQKQLYIRKENKTWGWVDVFFENAWLNSVMHCITAKQTLQKHYHPEMQEREMLVEGRLTTYYDKGPLIDMPLFELFDRDLNLIHGYHNPYTTVAKFLGFNDRLFQDAYEVLVDDNRLPAKLKSYKPNCLIIGANPQLLEVLAEKYNVIAINDKDKQIWSWSIPVDFTSLESVFKVKLGLGTTKIELFILNYEIVSPQSRLEQKTYYIEETLQRNYIWPALLLLDLINKSIIDQQSKIIFTTRAIEHPLIESLIQKPPEALFLEPEDYKPEQQIAVAEFMLHGACYHLSELGYSAVNLVLEENITANKVALLLTEILSKNSNQGLPNTPYPKAILNYDCRGLWDLTRNFYIKTQQQFQKICSNRNHQIRIWTWNIYGIKHNKSSISLSQRMHFLLEKIIHEQPDIICLQEVTPEIWQHYLHQFCEKNGYSLSEVPENTKDKSDFVFVATLSRLHVEEERLLKLQNDDISKDYYALYQSYGDYSVINLHLVAGKAQQQEREAQINSILSHFKIDECSLLAGDFNSDLNQISIVPKPFLDVWKILCPKEKGYTEDLDTNFIREEIKQQDVNKQSRRVDGFFIQQTQQGIVRSISRLGIEAIHSGQFISDHYGVECILDFLR